MSLSALPKEVQLIIAEHAVENVGPDESSAISFDASEHVDLETAQTRRCISVLASLNKHWYELCRPMLWKVRAATLVRLNTTLTRRCARRCT